MVVTFYPPQDQKEESNGHLNVGLVLRPTLPHPDLIRIFDPSKTSPNSAVRLKPDRDMGKPVDALEIDGNATKEQVREIEKILCYEIPDLESVCKVDSEIEFGKIAGTTGESLQSYPLALTQLLMTYHMLKASYTHQ